MAHRLALLAGAIAAVASLAAQLPAPSGVPRLWTDEALANWALPIAGVKAAPKFYSEVEYYAAPVDEVRTYPVYIKSRTSALLSASMRRHDGLSKRCGCTARQWTKCSHPWHFAFCHGKDATGRKVRHRVSLHRFADRPAGEVMSRSEAEALADRIRTDVRAGTCALTDVNAPTLAELTLADVADRYLRDYARRDTRKPHAVRQFEIHVRLLLESVVDTTGHGRGVLGAVPFRAVTRADLDAVFRGRLDAVNEALAAARQVAALRAEQRDVPADLLKSATLAGRSTKGGHVGLNRFKARVRHLFNWAIAQRVPG